MTKQAGFEEVSHTADWALRVWSPDFVGLLEQAARGMNFLTDCLQLSCLMFEKDFNLILERWLSFPGDKISTT
jgi:hypothetical protein